LDKEFARMLDLFWNGGVWRYGDGLDGRGYESGELGLGREITGALAYEWKVFSD
jgi:hypothetical protein